MGKVSMLLSFFLYYLLILLKELQKGGKETLGANPCSLFIAK